MSNLKLSQSYRYVIVLDLHLDYRFAAPSVSDASLFKKYVSSVTRLLLSYPFLSVALSLSLGSCLLWLSVISSHAWLALSRLSLSLPLPLSVYRLSDDVPCGSPFSLHTRGWLCLSWIYRSFSTSMVYPVFVSLPLLRPFVRCAHVCMPLYNFLSSFLSFIYFLSVHFSFSSFLFLPVHSSNSFRPCAPSFFC